MPFTMRPTGLASPAYAAGAGNGQGSGHDRDHEQLAVRPHLAAKLFPIPTLACVSPTSSRTWPPHNFFGLAANPRNVNHIS